ncbi:hypothetical protein QTP70_033667, partial [Hemibagrus guttatus]
RHQASRQDTPWMECQPIAGHTHTHSHTMGNLETPVSLEACLWTAGGNRSTRREPTKHEENMQTPHTQWERDLNSGRWSAAFSLTLRCFLQCSIVLQQK